MYLSHTELLPHLRFAPVGAGHVPPAHSTFKSIGNLSYQVAPHCVLPQPSKAFVIRSFFFEKWLLTHVFKPSPAGKPASKFRPFFPWYYANSGLISLNISLSALILSSFPTTHTAPVSRIAFVIGARARMSSTVAFKISSRSFFSISSL